MFATLFVKKELEIFSNKGQDELHCGIHTMEYDSAISKWTVDRPNDIDEPQNNSAEWKKSDQKEESYCNSICTKL